MTIPAYNRLACYGELYIQINRTLKLDLQCSLSPVTCEVSFLNAVKSPSSHPATHPTNGGTLCTDSPHWIFHLPPFETTREQQIVRKRRRGEQQEERSIKVQVCARPVPPPKNGNIEIDVNSLAFPLFIWIQTTSPLTSRRSLLVVFIW